MIMTSRKTSQKLREFGFEFDEDVTGQHPVTKYWFGTIDPIGHMQVAGDNCCMGHYVSGATRADMDVSAIKYAQWAYPDLIPCEDRDCEMHARNEEEAS